MLQDPDAADSEDSLNMLPKSYITIRSAQMRAVLRVQAEICAAIRDCLSEQGFLELLPPIVGPVTDPGIRGARQASIDFYGHEYKVMSSAILYKQMAVSALGKVYFFSPNVRLEPLETVGTRRHLCEFVQVDVEEPFATYRDAMSVAEQLLRGVCRRIVEACDDQLKELGRDLRVPAAPFRRLPHRRAVEMLRSRGYSLSWDAEIPWCEEVALSEMFEEPFFVIDYPKGARGFYDKEDLERPGTLRDFDLLYPEGYGEAASGAEREHELEKVLGRMKQNGEDPARYGWYVDMLRYGVLPSAGFGIGIERLTRYVCGLEAVWEARPFPKVAGIPSP